MSALAAVLLCFVFRFVSRSFCQCVSHPCNAPSNTSTACRRFVTARRTLRRLVADLQQPVEHFDGLSQVCNSSSNTSTACRRFATARRTLRRPVAGLQQLVEHFDGLSQVCNSSSNTSTACRRFATARRTLRRPIASPATTYRQILRGLIGRSSTRDFCAISALRLIK